MPDARLVCIWGKKFVCYRCPHCGERLESPLIEATTDDTCPECGGKFVVPGGDLREKEGERQKQERAVVQAASQRGGSRHEFEEPLPGVAIGAIITLCVISILWAIVAIIGHEPSPRKQSAPASSPRQVVRQPAAQAVYWYAQAQYDRLDPEGDMIAPEAERWLDATVIQLTADHFSISTSEAQRLYDRGVMKEVGWLDPDAPDH